MGRGGGGRGYGGWGKGGGGHNWRQYVVASDDPSVIEWCRNHIEEFKSSGEQQREMEWMEAKYKTTLRHLAPTMGVGWTKIGRANALVRLGDVSEDKSVMMQRLMDSIKQCVEKNGGSATTNDIKWALPIELTVFMQTKLNVKNLKWLGDSCGAELAAAGLKMSVSGRKISLEGQSEDFEDSIGVEFDVGTLCETRLALEGAMKQLPPPRQRSVKSFGCFLSSAADPMGPAELSRQQASPGYCQYLPQRQRLPVFESRAEIVETVRSCQVVLIVGATGCGKTTQIPQFLLEDLASNGEDFRIVATQPRRISAYSVAQRVAAERGEQLGESIGYKVRFEDSRSEATKVVFCTVGILLRILQGNVDFQGASHIIVDEVHERDLHTDFLLALIRKVLQRRGDLKIILMSATVDPSAFQEYFSGVKTIQIPGKTNYPIEELFLEDVLAARPSLAQSSACRGDDYGGSWGSKSRRKPAEPQPLTGISTDEIEIMRDLRCTREVAAQIARTHCAPVEQIDFDLVAGVVHWINREKGHGAILVFVPGWFEILETMKRLQAGPAGSSLSVFPLHSRIPSIDQQAIFHPPPHGTRKVIVSTVLAESSITVEDIVFVVDSGRNKSTFFNEESLIPQLKTVWYSKANGLQRRGRSGRCQPGAWYRLFSSMQWDAMRDYELPEMLRSPLEEVCLEVASLELGAPAEFLATGISPPKANVVKHAVNLLHSLGAVEDPHGAVLTPLGWKLTTLQVHPMLGKMLLLAGLFRCFQPIMTISAALGYKSPFVCPMGKEKQANDAKIALADGSASDHFALLNAHDGWIRGKWRFAQDNFLSGQTMEYIERLRSDLGEAARDILATVPKDLDDPKYLANVTRAVLVAGLWPKVAWLRKRGKVDMMGGGKAKIHPGSVNARIHGFENRVCVFYDIQETTDTWLYDTTMVEMPHILLFASDVKKILQQGDRALLSLGSWRVSMKANVADELLRLRKLMNEFISRSVGEALTPAHTAATDALARLFSEHVPVDRDEDEDDGEAENGDDDETASCRSRSDAQANATAGVDTGYRANHRGTRQEWNHTGKRSASDWSGGGCGTRTRTWGGW